MLPVVVTLAASLAAAAVAALVVRRHVRLDLGGPAIGGEAVRHAVRSHPRAAEAIDRHTSAPAAAGLGMGVGTIALVGAAAGVGVVWAMVRSGAGLEHSDAPIARWAAHHATGGGTALLRAVSELGGTRGVLVVAVVTVASQLPRLRPHAERAAMLALVTLTVGGQFVVSNVVKVIVHRARPDIDQLTGHSGPSFPSGHATAAAATFAVVALIVGRGRSVRTATALWAAAVGIAVAVASTRVMLGVHWTTDVVAGLLTGWGWFALCSVAFGGRLLRFGAPAEVAHAVTGEGRRDAASDDASDDARPGRQARPFSARNPSRHSPM